MQSCDEISPISELSALAVSCIFTRMCSVSKARNFHREQLAHYVPDWLSAVWAAQVSSGNDARIMSPHRLTASAALLLLLTPVSLDAQSSPGTPASARGTARNHSVNKFAENTQDSVAGFVLIPFQFNFNGRAVLTDKTFFNLDFQPADGVHILRDADTIKQNISPIRRFPETSDNPVVASPLPAGGTTAQEMPNARTAPVPEQSNPIRVNWLYGAYVPRDAELNALTGPQRKRLYLHQTFLTWGIYFKTAMFSLGDQASTSPPQWGDGIGGYGKRFASRYGQFAVQNTLSTAGNFLLRYEPRYDRCRCNGAWPRIRHALVRNFVTYDSSERARRPQIALYGGALGAGMVASVWKPTQSSPWVSGYQSVVTQVVFGSFSNVVGEFAPEISRLFKRNRNKVRCTSCG
jgi:hypothetical protein